jgi:DNA-binding MarR family transcriptional regulator
MLEHVSDLQSHLGYWLRMVSNGVSYAFARKVEAEGVTVAEWVFMRHLRDVEPVAPGTLAERMGMTRGAISKLAERLVGKSLVDRVPDPDDGRGQLLSLTPAGRQKVPRLAVLADDNDTEHFGVLTEDERHRLETILRRLVEAHGLKDAPTE